MDVIDGCAMQRLSTALPTVPVEPVRMIFILLNVQDVLKVDSSGDVVYYCNDEWCSSSNLERFRSGTESHERGHGTSYILFASTAFGEDVTRR